MSSYTPQQFVEDWRSTPLGERASYQLHFIDVCRLVGHEPPTGRGVDSSGLQFRFERELKKDTGTPGFADVYYENHFAIEYKAPGKYKDLNDAYQQLLQYREKLNNPPLLVVTDIHNWAIHTNWPNTEKKVYEFKHEDIATRPSVLQMLRDLFTAPERLHPRRNTEQVTKEAAAGFQLIADNLRAWERQPERIAHFLTKLVFCLFAEDVSLLPPGPGGTSGIFSEIVDQTRTDPKRFVRYVEELFRAMADGGDVLLQRIPYFNGSLFEDVEVEELSLEALTELARAARLNWQSVEPAIFGTLFERSLDPAKRSQLGAHYTSREDILLIVEPVLMQPLQREWEQIQEEAKPIREKYDEALKGSNRRLITTYGGQLEALRERMLKRLREIRVLDPACGSGNFLYVCLQRLMDMEKAVMNSDLFAGLTLPIPEVHPRQMYGIEKDPIAHALASIVVWIGWLQWQQMNGYATLTHREPILEALSDNIVCRDAILEFPSLRSGESEMSNPFPSLRSGEGLGVGTSSPHTRTTADLWPKIKLLARELRTGLTPAEHALWQRLRGKQIHGFKFRRQHPVDRFIVDFYCSQARLVVEVDGPIHEQQQEYDELRQAFIESLGLRVLRFTNDEVLGDIESVLARIEEALQSPPPGPLPAAQEGGEATEPDWPEVDVIVSNPPFLGGKKMRTQLGDYVDDLFKLYRGRVPPEADLVCYWFEKARAHIEQGKAKRAGLLATNSIRGGANREVLKRIKDSGDIFMAWSDRDWILDGAAVRVSMVGFDNGEDKTRTLDGNPVANITPDLTGSIDLTQAHSLQQNTNLAFMGVTPAGPFDIPGDLARKMLSASNASLRSNQDVIRPYFNAMDIVRGVRDVWTIDFGVSMTEAEAMQYELPYQYIKEHVYPIRRENNRQAYRDRWWIYAEARPAMRQNIQRLSRYIATPMVAKHRIFVWVDKHVIPANLINVIARDDDYFFGVLHSRLHEVWSLRMGTWLGKGNDPRYTPTTTFETFPFPVPPGQENPSSAAYQAISAAAKQLHEERAAWLNPPLLVQRGGAGGGDKNRTLTNLYNGLNAWRGIEKMKIKPEAADFAPRLDELHQALDRAVCDAYGWTDMGGEGYAFNIYTPAGEEEILRRLLALNLSRAAGR